VRSVRYPGIISYKTEPGGGTTDYAVEIFYEALRDKVYTSFVSRETCLPMMYMDDAVQAAIQIMQCDPEKIRIRSSYNLTGVSFTVEQLVREIQKYIPEFRCNYAPDFRQQIADSWPRSIDDSRARRDWGWRHQYDLPGISKVMLEKLREKLNL
jgi:nucleoside-diphosphate-sugar epimerase